MKTILAAASAALALAAAPALVHAQAQPTPMFYGTIGYADSDLNHVNLGAIQGRLGARIGPYFGVEGELAGGVASDHYTSSGVDARVKLQNQEAIYGVGFLPLSPKLDVLARIGYGGQTFKVSTPGASASDSDNSWNYGVGAQYHFDDKNGVRADYTREAFLGARHSANVWAIAYTRSF